jgi:hypothetical protein
MSRRRGLGGLQVLIGRTDAYVCCGRRNQQGGCKRDGDEKTNESLTDSQAIK